MRLRRFLTSCFLKSVLALLCRIDSREMAKVPSKGPMLVCINHINFLEVPLMQMLFSDRPVRGVSKKESWDNRALAFLMKTYRAIPLDRGGSNIAAFTCIRHALEEGYFIIIAPEGTRSGDGILREGKPGAAALALMTGAPILPIAHMGGEKIWDNVRRFRRTAVTVKVGTPFYLNPRKKSRGAREVLTKEIMVQLAQLLPPSQRGIYDLPPFDNTSRLKFLTRDSD